MSDNGNNYMKVEPDSQFFDKIEQILAYAEQVTKDEYLITALRNTINRNYQLQFTPKGAHDVDEFYKDDREPGYYWVKYEDSWVIGRFDGTPELGWEIAGSDGLYSDDSFDEINETQIQEP